MTKRILLFLIITAQILLIHYSYTLAKSPKKYLEGKFYESVENNFLIATEKMQDERFDKTVIVMLQNDENGSWGLVINKLIGMMPIALLLDASLSSSEEREKLYKINIPVYWGGPVEVRKIFILHSNEYKSVSTKKYGNISISQDHKILLDIAKNKGPEKKLIILGYAGWASGQLEGEMERDDWMLSDIKESIIFDQKANKKWEKAFKSSFIKI